VPQRAKQPPAQPKVHAKPQRTQAELEAEADAAEAEARAAEARARAIRLRIDAQANAKTALDPQDSEPPQTRRAPTAKPPKATVAKPRNSPARANGLRLDDRVKVVAPGGDYLKVGTVTKILDNGEVEVKLGMLSGTCSAQVFIGVAEQDRAAPV
jgi:sRNA-binding protein